MAARMSHEGAATVLRGVRLRDGTTVRFWKRDDGRHAYQVLCPGGGGESGSGRTRVEAEQLAAQAIANREVA